MPKPVTHLENWNSTIMADTQSQVTLRTRKFLRNALLGRKQMVVWVFITTQPSSRWEVIYCHDTDDKQKKRCPSSQPRKRVQGRSSRKIGRNLQSEQRPSLCLRVQNPIRWRKEHRVRADLRLAWGSQEIRAPLSACEIRNCVKDWEAEQTATYVLPPQSADHFHDHDRFIRFLLLGSQRADFVVLLWYTQASNAKTEQRLCGERPKQRVVSRTRQRRSKGRHCVLLSVVSGNEGKYCQRRCCPVLSIVWNYDICRTFWGEILSYRHKKLSPPSQKSNNLQLLAFVKPWYKSCEYCAFCRDRSRRHQIKSTLSIIAAFFFFTQILNYLTVSSFKKSESIRICRPQRIHAPPPSFILPPLISLDETQLPKIG